MVLLEARRDWRHDVETTTVKRMGRVLEPIAWATDRMVLCDAGSMAGTEGTPLLGGAAG